MMLIPFGDTAHSLSCPGIGAKPTKEMVLDVLACQFAKQYLHLMIESGVIGGGTYDESVVAEHVADDIGMVGLRDVIHHDVLHTCLARCTCYHLSCPLGVAVHRAVADDQTFFGLIT